MELNLLFQEMYLFVRWIKTSRVRQIIQERTSRAQNLTGNCPTPSPFWQWLEAPKFTRNISSNVQTKIIFSAFHDHNCFSLLGKTHTLMAPDGITAGVIERCFKRITQDERHDYKVQSIATMCSCFFQKLRSWVVQAMCVSCIITDWKLRRIPFYQSNRAFKTYRIWFWKSVYAFSTF